MSEAEAAAILARRKREHLCVALLRAPDGRVHFRGDQEVLVPAARLRRMVRASALALSVAACTSSEEAERVEPVAHEAFEQPPSESGSPDVIPPPQLNPQGQLEVERDTEDFEMLAGTPLLDEPEPDGELHVAFKELRPIRTPDPHPDDLQVATAGREEATLHISIRFCVDEKGRVVDAERAFGDERIARTFIRTMDRWRFEPYKVDGRKTRVCTERRFTLHLERNRPA